MGKQKYIMANLVYGQLYPEFWLENQLKTLCDPTNLPALREKYEIEYALLTDEPTLQNISRHPNFMRLGQICPVNIVKMQWPPDANQFGSRYGLLCQLFHMILKVALEKNALLSVWVADLVFAQGAMPKMLGHMERGHDAVFMVPIRSAADSLNAWMQSLPGAPTDMELFNAAYHNLHHLWTHATWDNPYFSKFPYSIVWNSGTGLVTHNFGITPIVFRPTAEMEKVQGVIDADVPSFCKNPYWAYDWTDAPVAGVEPLSNGHYPPFLQHRADINWVVEWAKKGTQPVQAKNLHEPLYYPSKAVFNAPMLETWAKEIATNIQNRLSSHAKP